MGTDHAADWTKPGVELVGGSHDGECIAVFPASGSMNLSHEIASQEVVELYERTTESRDGRTVYRFVRRRPDLET